MKLDVLAFAAHPDDTELSCAGTLAALVKQGLKVGVADLTQGEMGTRGTPQLRLEEAEEAAKILGLTARVNLGLPDCHIRNTPDQREAIIRTVRTYRPTICLVNSPSDRHPDHGNAAQMCIDAFFYSGLRKITTNGDDGKPQDVWRPLHVLHYMQDRTFTPDIVFDISDTIEIKEKAILAFRSQFNVDEPGDEPETYISSTGFFQQLRARSSYFGHQIGAAYGEPFLYHGGPIPMRDLGVLLGYERKR